MEYIKQFKQIIGLFLIFFYVMYFSVSRGLGGLDTTSNLNQSIFLFYYTYITKYFIYIKIEFFFMVFSSK